MNIRKAMIIGSIGLASIVGCKRKEPLQPTTTTQVKNAVVQIPTETVRYGAVGITTTDIDGDGDADIIVAVNDYLDNKVDDGTVTIYTFKNDGKGNYQ